MSPQAAALCQEEEVIGGNQQQEPVAQLAALSAALGLQEPHLGLYNPHTLHKAGLRTS